jgi:hypothetical protein
LPFISRAPAFSCYAAIMARLAMGCGFLFAICSLTAAPEKNEPEESFEVEPPILAPNLERDRAQSATNKPADPAAIDPEKLARQAERARRVAAGTERLVKIGALSKVEAEQRVLRAVRLEAEFESVRLAHAKETLLEQETRARQGEISRSAMQPVESELALAIQAAHAAEDNRRRTELAAAEANLQRQQKLLALGAGRKSEVARATEKLAQLKGTAGN